MKRVTLLLIAALAFCQVQAEIIFVKPNGSGNGASWSSATGDQHKALATATPGDQIWVAAGEYLTTSGTDRSLYFQIPSDVKVYGGFAGYENALNERNVENNPTKLSGEIGLPTADDNAYTVVYTENVSNKTLVDGFIITGGSANEETVSNDVNKKVCGAGWFNLATNGATSSPVIQNCRFIDNNAREGAGFFNYADGGECRPKIEHCQFIRNVARLDGGAVYNGAMNGINEPQIVKCRFESNEATYGAGLLNKANGGSVRLLIKSCQFVANQAHFRGSGIYNDYSGNGSSKAIMAGCLFDQNVSSTGEAVSSRSGGSFDSGSNINSRGY